MQRVNKNHWFYLQCFILKHLNIMNIVISFYALIYSCSFVQLEVADGSMNKQCYKAKTCIHNNREKCGINSTGTARRFLDLCDIFEYNCLKGTDFIKDQMNKCSKLKSLYNHKKTHLSWGDRSDEVFANNFNSDPDASSGSDRVWANNFDSQDSDNGYYGGGGGSDAGMDGGSDGGDNGEGDDDGGDGGDYDYGGVDKRNGEEDIGGDGGNNGGPGYGEHQHEPV